MGDAHNFEVVRYCPGRFPIQIVDAVGLPHAQLTVYANKAAETLSGKSVPVYVGEVLKVFSWALNDQILQEEEQSLMGPASQVRRILSEYLVADCKCVVRYRQDSGVTTTIIVRRSSETRVNVKIALAAMKHFYSVMGGCDLYSKSNPLVSEELARSIASELQHRQRVFIQEHGRASPLNSGGVDDNWRDRLRYSTNYFQLADGEWKPQVISDSRLPTMVYKAGEVFGWSLRSHVISHLLFESGGRINDVVDRNLEDWLRHDCLNQLESDSKGSHGNRIKTLAFSTETANLLRRYFNTERAEVERGPFRTLGEIQKAVRKGQLDPKTAPLFLSRSGKAYSPNSFRDDCWRPAMKAAGIKCQPHQARHWFVTAALQHIDETSKNEAERARRRNELVKYMKWKSQEMLTVYDHTGTRAAAGMKTLHDKFSVLEKLYQVEHLEELKKQYEAVSNTESTSKNTDELAAIFKLIDGDNGVDADD